MIKVKRRETVFPFWRAQRGPKAFLCGHLISPSLRLFVGPSHISTQSFFGHKRLPKLMKSERLVRELMKCLERHMRSPDDIFIHSPFLAGDRRRPRGLHLSLKAVFAPAGPRHKRPIVLRLREGNFINLLLILDCFIPDLIHLLCRAQL